MEKLKITTVPASHVLYTRRQATLSTLSQVPGMELIAALQTDAEKEGLEIVGPPCWIYEGVGTDLDAPFQLDVALPIAAPAAYQGEFAVRELPAYECAIVTHEGPWSKLFDTYSQLAKEVVQYGFQSNDGSREYYHVALGPDAPENRTEVQFGIEPIPVEA